MHDSQAEDRLRGLLRAEGDSLSLTITTAELERRLEARRRAAQGRRVSFMAAAVALIAVGTMVAAANGWVSLPAIGIVGTSPSPAPSHLHRRLPSRRRHRPARRSHRGRRSARHIRPSSFGRSVIPVQPTGFTVTRVDPVTGEAALVATIPQSVLPENLSLTGVPDHQRDRVARHPVQRRGECRRTASVGPHRGRHRPDGGAVDHGWPGQLSWTADEQLGVTHGGIYLDDPQPGRNPTSRHRNGRIPRSGHDRGIVWSTEPGTVLLAQARRRRETGLGLDRHDGAFIPATDLPAAYQRTGLERPTGAAAHTVGQPCPRSAAPRLRTAA